LIFLFPPHSCSLLPPASLTCTPLPSLLLYFYFLSAPLFSIFSCTLSSLIPSLRSGHWLRFLQRDLDYPLQTPRIITKDGSIFIDNSFSFSPSSHTFSLLLYLIFHFFLLSFHFSSSLVFPLSSFFLLLLLLFTLFLLLLLLLLLLFFFFFYLLSSSSTSSLTPFYCMSPARAARPIPHSKTAMLCLFYVTEGVDSIIVAGTSLSQGKTAFYLTCEPKTFTAPNDEC